MELQIVKALFDKQTYDTYSEQITEKQFEGGRTSAIYKVLTVLRDYYNKFEQPITPSALKKIHEIKLQGSSEKERERILNAYEDIELEEGEENATALFEEFKLSNIRLAVQAALDDNDDEKAQALMEELNQVQTEDDNEITGMNLQELMEDSTTEGLEVFLPKLKEFIPTLTFGTGQLIVARSNSGKTSYLVNQALCVAKRGARVLHLALSEDGERELKTRYINAAYKVPDIYVEQNVTKAQEKFIADYGDRLGFFVGSTTHIKSLEQKIKEFKPDLVIYDQYQKVLTSEANKLSTPEQRTKAASVIKDMAIKYKHHYICATQADKDAKWVVTALNVDQAKTGAVGEFKIIIGLGAEGDDRLRTIIHEGKQKQALLRNINVAKNKGKMGMFSTYLCPETAEWVEV